MYPSYPPSPATTGATAAAAAGSIQSIPTSLASLLNDSNRMYVSYPNPAPQAQDSLDGADTMMTFTPSHYYDGMGAMGWPLISIPPGQQS